MPEMLEVGARVRTVRKRLGYHRRQVAQSAGLSSHQLASIERGRSQPTINEVRSIAGSLGVEVDEFLSGVDQPLPVDRRISDVFDELPNVDPLPADETPSAPSRERRLGLRAEARLERAFAKVSTQLDDVTRVCERIASADADDDMGALLATLEDTLTKLRANPAFSVAVEKHQEAMATYATALDIADAASWRTRANQRAGTTPDATNSSTTEPAPA